MTPPKAKTKFGEYSQRVDQAYEIANDFFCDAADKMPRPGEYTFFNERGLVAVGESKQTEGGVDFMTIPEFIGGVAVVCDGDPSLTADVSTQLGMLIGAENERTRGNR